MATITKDVAGSSRVSYNYTVNKSIRQSRRGRFTIIKVSGTESAVLQYLADNHIDRSKIINIAPDNTWVVYCIKG